MLPDPSFRLGENWEMLQRSRLQHMEWIERKTGINLWMTYCHDIRNWRNARASSRRRWNFCLLFIRIMERYLSVEMGKRSRQWTYRRGSWWKAFCFRGRWQMNGFPWSWEKKIQGAGLPAISSVQPGGFLTRYFSQWFWSGSSICPTSLCLWKKRRSGDWNFYLREFQKCGECT